MDTLLATENAFYDKHRGEFLQAHRNQYLLIHGDTLHGVYDTQGEAVDAGYEEFGQGPYLVRKAGDDVPVISNPALAVGVLLGSAEHTV